MRLENQNVVGASVRIAAASPEGVLAALKPDHRAEPLNRVSLPPISWKLLRLFTWYSRRYVKNHFHAVRLSQSGFPPEVGSIPLVIYSNHASWWDPLVGLVLRDDFFPSQGVYAPMDAQMLRRYGFFRRLGFFGVEPQTRRGAVQFLRTAEAVLASSENILAVTPQGRFADVRERPVRFASGLGHLAARVRRASFTPLAIEYVFWEERLPEILVRFGAPIEVRGGGESEGENGAHWTAVFEKALEQTQEALRVEACRRCPDDFVKLFGGRAGQAATYDFWRYLKSYWSDEPFRKEHGFK